MLCVFAIQWAEYQLNGQIVLLENVMFGMCMYTYLGVLGQLWFWGRTLRHVNQSSCIALNGGMLSIKETLLGTLHECNNGWVTCESNDWGGKTNKKQMGKVLFNDTSLRNCHGLTLLLASTIFLNSSK